jgi:hypothetical protein
LLDIHKPELNRLDPELQTAFENLNE